MLATPPWAGLSTSTGGTRSCGPLSNSTAQLQLSVMRSELALNSTAVWLKSTRGELRQCGRRTVES